MTIYVDFRDFSHNNLHIANAEFLMYSLYNKFQNFIKIFYRIYFFRLKKIRLYCLYRNPLKVSCALICSFGHKLCT